MPAATLTCARVSSPPALLLTSSPFCHQRKSSEKKKKDPKRSPSTLLAQAPRDDLLALVHVLVFLHRGKLPWQGLGRRKGKGEKRKKRATDVHMLVAAKMMETSVSSLTEGLPREFAEFARYARGLGFYDEPDYEKAKRFFTDGIRNNGWQNDGKFDWCKD
jgi:hypothetical protein